MRPPFPPRRSDPTPAAACYARYQSDAAVAQYCDAHYGPDKFGVPNFPARLARLCIEATAGGGQRRALELGCAVGRASFELADCFERVDGVDVSPRFIDIARALQERGKITYQIFEEGDIVSDRRVSLIDLGLAASASRVVFQVGDALRLDGRFADCDLVLAANLLDRLPDPEAFLASAHRLLVVGGVLAIASPYNWMEPFTPRGKWLGGFFRAGAPMTSTDAMRKRLDRHFAPLGDPQDLELVIRENARKFQHYVSQLTLWRRVR